MPRACWLPDDTALTAATGFIDVGGARLEYALSVPPAGVGEGPVIVLLHEGLGCVAMWKSFPDALARTSGLRVMSYSRAGYGQSSPIALPRPLDFHTREALDVLPLVLNRLGIREFVLCGHSDGASIALVCAGALAPAGLAGVAVMAPHVLTEDKSIATISAAIDEYESGDLRTRLARYHGANVDGAFRGWSGAWTDPGFRAWSIERHLPGIRVPVLCIRGERDPYNTSVHVERIAALSGGPVERVDLRDAGHAPHVEAATSVTERLAAFCAAPDTLCP